MRRVAPEQLRDDFGIQGGTSDGDPLQRLDEVADVGHPVLQQVADAGGVVGQEVGGVAGLDVLGEQEDAQPLVAGAQLQGEAEALVGEGRRHADVDHRDVGRVLGHRAAQRGRVPDGAGDGEAAVDQQLDQPVAQDGGVLGDGDAERADHQEARGRSTVTTVGPPGGLTRCSRPSTACTRSVSPASPLEEEPTVVSCAPPVPSSRTTMRSQRPLLRAGDRGPRGLGVLGHVGEELGHAEVGDRLDGGRRPRPELDGELGGHRAAGGQRGQGALQADVERRRVDAAGDVAQFGDGLLGAPVGGVDELAHPVEVDVLGIVLELLLGHAEPHGERHQLGLGAVVQVALDPAQRGGRGVDRLRPGLFEGAHPRRHGIGPEQAADQHAVDVDEAPHDPGRREEEDGAENEDGDAVEEVRSDRVEVVRREEHPGRAPTPGGRPRFARGAGS